MKNLLLLFCTIALFTVSGLAQTDNGWGVSFHLKNYDNIFNGSTSPNLSTIQGAEIGILKRLAPWADFHVPLSLGTVAHYDDTKNLNATTGIFAIHALLNLQPAVNWPVVPYVFGGIGGQEIKSTWDVGIPFGGGLNFRLGDNAAFNLSTGYRKSFTTDRSSWQNSLGFIFGLGFGASMDKSTSMAPIVTPVDAMAAERARADAAAAAMKAKMEADAAAAALAASAAEKTKMEAEVAAANARTAEAEARERAAVKARADAEAAAMKAKAEAAAQAQQEHVIEAKKQEVLKVMTYAMQGVQFETGSAVLKPASFTHLDNVYRIMADNPTVNVSIGGHTDNTGSEAINQKLSAARAKACHDYLISKGIGAARLKSVGYGSSQSRESNATEAGRKANRRVEFNTF